MPTYGVKHDVNSNIMWLMLILLPKGIYRKIDTENVMTCTYEGNFKMISTSILRHQLGR